MSENLPNPAPKGRLDKGGIEAIRKALIERNALTACSRCGELDTLGVLPSIAYIDMQTVAEMISGTQEQSVPVAVLACANCGAIYSHALGALGLMHLGAGGHANEA